MTYDYKVVEVVKIVDGDTVDLRIDLGFHMSALLRFRLLGVDTPERGQEGWAEATLFTRTWLTDTRDVRVRTYKSDSFGRWLGVVYSEEDAGAISLSQALLDSGHAVVYAR